MGPNLAPLACLDPDSAVSTSPPKTTDPELDVEAQTQESLRHPPPQSIPPQTLSSAPHLQSVAFGLMAADDRRARLVLARLGQSRLRITSSFGPLEGNVLEVKAAMPC